MKLIQVEVITHAEQRYPTCGDWIFDGDTLTVRISDTGHRDSNILVAIHEIVEAFLCEAHGVTQEEVDSFDMAYEQNRTGESLEEPGDCVSAPYHAEHKAADIVERIVALNMPTDWIDHNARIGDLG